MGPRYRYRGGEHCGAQYGYFLPDVPAGTTKVGVTVEDTFETLGDIFSGQKVPIYGWSLRIRNQGATAIDVEAVSVNTNIAPRVLPGGRVFAPGTMITRFGEPLKLEPFSDVNHEVCLTEWDMTGNGQEPPRHILFTVGLSNGKEVHCKSSCDHP